MKFGEALEYLYGNKKDKEGVQRKQRIAREGWNGKGMYLVMFSHVCIVIDVGKSYSITEIDMEDDNCFENTYISDYVSNSEEKLCKLEDFILLKTAGNTFIPWNASQADVQANDWVIV